MTPGIDFTNILQAAFMLQDPKSTKRLTVILLPLRSASVKTARKALMKLTPVVYL